MKAALLLSIVCSVVGNDTISLNDTQGGADLLPLLVRAVPLSVGALPLLL